jgi:hypothetical protein
MKYYAGIGSRSTPFDVLGLMRDIAKHLGPKGWCLRSGGAQGADTAFEDAAINNHHPMEIYLPWPGFAFRPTTPEYIVASKLENYHRAREIAAQFHPAWMRCSDAARKLHTRNVYQILGRDLATPVEAVICWTPAGSGSGGTGQALRIARAHNIPIRDLGDPDVLSKARSWLYGIN